ncbi:LOW QUALITY PROTEIN: probable RNA-binding protein EIF1AD [Ptychodera flava]|uniref:LOW QUALITY PROTEIN: probable RNA-binding protein EIF1AD n=1 Tax=Ptychodera flava TaxID=63121 RepID=UPI003969E655
MSKATKRKHVFGEVLGDYILPEETQQIVKIAAPRGNNLHEVETPNGEKYLASMPRKFRKNVWIKRGDFVIVDPITEGDKVKAEISVILYPKQIKYIKQEGKWPLEFSDKENEDLETVTSYGARKSEKNVGSKDEDEESEESDNDDDLFVNTNRPNVFYEESEDSSDDEEYDDDVGIDDDQDCRLDNDRYGRKDDSEEVVDK